MISEAINSMGNLPKIEKNIFLKGIFDKAFTKVENIEVEMFVQEFFHLVDDALQIKSFNDDPFWRAGAFAILEGIILHSLYVNRKKEKLPTFWDILSDIKEIKEPEALEAFDAELINIANYPHISPEEFLNNDNPLEEIYGEYAYLKDINTALAKITKENTGTIETIEDVRQCIIKNNVKIDWGINVSPPNTAEEFDAWSKRYPFRHLLTHPEIRAKYLYLFIKPPSSKEKAYIRTRIIQNFDMYITNGKALKFK